MKSFINELLVKLIFLPVLLLFALGTAVLTFFVTLFYVLKFEVKLEKKPGDEPVSTASKA